MISELYKLKNNQSIKYNLKTNAMRKMFTRLFSLALLLLLFSAISVVNAQNHCGSTISASDVVLVTDLTTVCDGDQVTFEVVGYPGAEFAFNYDGDLVGGFSPDSAFTVNEGDPFRVIVRENDSCISNEITIGTDVVEPITLGDATAEHPTCGDTLGEISVHFTGGIGDFTYWIVPIDSFGTPPYDDYDTPTANNSAKPGTYVVTVQDQNMCFDITDNANWDTITVNATTPPVLIDTIFGTDPVCAEGDGTVTVVASAGTPASYGYIVDLFDVSAPTVVVATDTTVMDTAIFMDIPAGTYQAMVTDSLGCEDLSDSTVTIVVPEEVEFEIEITDVSCAEAGNGEIQVAITNYVAGVEYAAYVESADSVYEWVVDGGDSIINITGLDPVYYALYVKDSTNQCIAIGYINPNGSGNKITVQAPGEIMFAVVYDSIQCRGDSVLVSLDSITGGNGSGLEFQLFQDGSLLMAWYDSTEWLLPAEDYTIYARNADGDGCEVSEAFEISQPARFGVWGEETSPTCPGGNDGVLTIGMWESHHGTSGAIYEYSIDGTTWYNNNVFAVEAGTYTVYARDTACTHVVAMKENQVVESPGDNYIYLDSDTVIDCYGETKHIDMDYSNWADQSGEDRDIRFYYTTDEDLVFVDGTPMMDSTWVGFGPWAHWEYDYDEADLEAGTYYIWASDDYGCFSEDYETVIVIQPGELMVMGEVTEHATCNDDNDGLITVEGFGGDRDDYLWGIANNYLAAMQMSTDAMQEGLTDSTMTYSVGGGSYFVVLYDDDCDERVISEEFVVESYDAVTVSDTALMVTDIVCYGDSVGVIEINAATGGSGDLVYTLWTEGDTVAGYVEVTDTVFTNLKAGTYYVEVTDLGVGGCDGAWTDEIEVEQPQSFKWDIDAIDISCFGASDGVAEISIWGGNEGQHMFKLGAASWQPIIDNHKNVVIIEPGTYTIWLRDTLGCPAGSETFDIEQPDPLVVTVDTVINVSTACGADDGVVEISMVGGNSTYYDFYMFNADSSFTNSGDDEISYRIENLPADIYTIEVMESPSDSSRGCMTPITVTVTQPDTISYDAVVTQDVACKDGETGIITVSNIMGGSEEYNITISSALGSGVGVQDSNVFSELPAGWYVITVADDEGPCSTVSDTLVILEPDEYLTMGATKIQDITCAEPGKLSIQAEGGVGDYMYAAALSELPEHIVLPPATDSSAWQSDSIISVTEAGTWIVWTMDANGCIVGGEYDEDDNVVNEWRVPIAAPSVVVTVTLEDLMVDCNGDMTAMIVVGDANVMIEVDEVEADRGYTVTIDGIAGDTLSGLGADTIVVVVTDTLSGCSGTETVIITQPEVLEAELFVMDGEFTCPGELDGYIEVVAMGGSEDDESVTLAEKSASIDAPSGYWYQLWQDGILKTDYQPDHSFYVENNKEYFVVVKDANGCTDTTNTITIDPVAAVEIVEIMDVTCSSDTLASVKVTATAEGDRQVYVKWTQFEAESGVYTDSTELMDQGDIWINQMFEFDNENVNDIHYEILVIDEMGCVSGIDTVTFDQIISSPLELTVTEGIVNGCGTEVTITAAGGVAPYVIMVDDMEVTEDMVVLGGGMHTVKVMDVHECMVMEEITLAYPMSADTTIMTYTGEPVQFVVGDMLDTMLYAGEYSFYYDVDIACVAELNVVVTEIDRTQPVLVTATPMDTIADNHPTFVITFDGPVTFNEDVMGYLMVTPEDSTDALLMIEVTDGMVSGNTITVDYVVGDGEDGLNINTTYVVAVDSGIVMGDGLAWDGVVVDWMFTTGPDWATAVDPSFDAVEFKVYPNPFSNYITIENNDKLTRVVVSNIAGQRVIDVEYPEQTIRTEGLVSGLYFVSMFTEEGIVKTSKLVKK